MGKTRKYYVIWQGHRTGVFDSWSECENNIKGYPAARYKSFESKEAAEAAFKADSADYIQKGGAAAPKKKSTGPVGKAILDSISVDAACSGNPGDMEYRGVKTASQEEIFRVGPLAEGTNNIGEFLAIVHALAYLKQLGKDQVPIYSDSVNAMGWVRQKKAKTKLEQTRRNAKIFEMIDRAETWLRNNTYHNPILKWETKAWGENPADFGRK